MEHYCSVFDAELELYWDNTSSNEIIRRFIKNADVAVRNDIGRMISGEALEKRLVLNLTYQELDKKELLWSVMYQTGYLTLIAAASPDSVGLPGLSFLTARLKSFLRKKSETDEMQGGRSDIAIDDQRNSRAVIIETKRSKNYDDLEEDSEEALKQIQNREYAWPFQRKEYRVIAYGIFFVGKECYVRVKQ